MTRASVIFMVVGLWLAASGPVRAQEEPVSVQQPGPAQNEPISVQEHPISVQDQPVSGPEQSVSAQSHAPVREEARPYSLTVGVREWITQGRSAHNIGGVPNVSSELTYRGLNIPITQVHADLVVLKRLVADLEFGYGSRGHGTLLDQDWNSPNRTNKFSETLSNVTGGSVLTISLTTGLRLVSWNVQDNPLPGGIDILLGYQYWREQYEASGVQNLLTGTSSFNGVPAITQTNTWNSIRLGTRATVPILSRLVLKGSAFYIPYTAYKNEDIHHLRSDLRKDPSFLTEASGGNGVQLEASLLVRVWHRLTVEAGYAYWDIRSGTGTIQSFNANGIVGFGIHNEDNTRRQGVFFGANWTF